MSDLTTEDRERLDHSRERVMALMADGGWHTAEEIRMVGGSEGLRRFREIRRGQVWTKRYLGHGLWEYRVTGS